ncbi:MAG: hydantoinase/oxoprolinase family protein, partial [Rhodobacteraceae bacterium]|nr:hydantoinase/oxoprolinase family protein [Paracoccaceae bacterium]
LMVVRGDGALIAASIARERPIETILSGPAASIAGAGWLTGETDALVSDIGGTTTDVCLLRGGKPSIDPLGARVGPYRTMVEAVAMRTTGLGGDSEVHLTEGLKTELWLGPRRLVPVALLASQWPALVHAALDAALSQSATGEFDGRFVLPLWRGAAPAGLAEREGAIAGRLQSGPRTLADTVRTRLEFPALMRMVSRGLVMISGVTPSDAAHVLGQLDSWDGEAATKAVKLFARRRNGRGDMIAADATAMAMAIVDQLKAQTIDCLLEAALAEDSHDWKDEAPEVLARHPLMRAGLDRHEGVVRIAASIGVPVIGLGASAPNYYGSLGERLGTTMVLPEHAGVANAIGAVVGQVAMHVEGSVTSPGPGRFVAHLPTGPRSFGDKDAAIAALQSALAAEATERSRLSGVDEVRLSTETYLSEVEVEGQPMFIEARLKVTAHGRPRIAAD